MHNRHVHIICLDVPYPPDYGGVFDLFYKLPLLKAAGVDIHLHCFEYGRGEQPALEKYCYKVHYYKRKKNIAAVSLSMPYIVSSRNSAKLLTNLLADDFPVLMEGVHTSCFAKYLKGRKVVLRLHNAEYAYYNQLYLNSSSCLKKIYYKIEGALLKNYEVKLAGLVDAIAYVSPSDAILYEDFTPPHKLHSLPVFLPWSTVSTQAGTGDFALYQGNLGVAENNKAALSLVHMFIKKTNMPFIIAGKNPSKQLRLAIQQCTHIHLIANPSSEKMEELMQNAHIHLLPSFSETGIKLKLLHALFTGRHCVVNKKMLAGTPFLSICNIAETPQEWRKQFERLETTPISPVEIKKRQALLENTFNKKRQTEQLIQLLFTQ